MANSEIINNYIGYVENILLEGGKFESIEDAVEYAFKMYQEDSKLVKDRHHRFIGNKKFKEELRKK